MVGRERGVCGWWSICAAHQSGPNSCHLSLFLYTDDIIDNKVL